MGIYGSISNHGKAVDIGTEGLLHSVYSTAVIRLTQDDKEFLQFAMYFLKTGECVADDAQITARQMELIRRRFAKMAPEEAVFDLGDPRRNKLLENFARKSATSCASLYITADGKDFFDEVIKLLKYADIRNVDTVCG